MPLDLTTTSIELTRQICDIESVSGNETALADEIEQALERMPHLDVLRDGDLVVARTHLGRARRVVIAGHIDTVPVNRNLPTRFETEDGVDYLWGRGTVDMKPGVAVALKLAAELAEPSVDLTWLFYDHEEVTSDLNGLARLARTRPELLAGDFAILGEPSNGAVEGGCNGTMRFDVVTRGKRAHSARGWMGENAIHKAAPILDLLAAFEPETIEVDGLAYREQLNAVLASGGVAGNVIPDEFRVHVNYRFAPSRSADQAEATMRGLFEPLGEFELKDLSPGARPGLDDPLAQEFLAAVGLEAKPKYGWTDVARFSALGIPAVNFGPGDPSLAHADDERVPLAQITACEDALRAWLR
ncbi:succinyl-diaminopimelate desuccinylase [Gryllotalpicola protaetiae]|uniref:Succinyl-diaminopimelate desuccinylase n=1 Tax=Gryllotalpicola protaetiae TaxID=2419771 RepID=A0A387BK46_9MICO|nr:succinyl-diaminopimelate desuccinylase [Gryllotalpicola protaetiae]AYG02544.1 succinyl-diaminopimelate desuccinylase [Gryllotalpicola protaetiae]